MCSRPTSRTETVLAHLTGCRNALSSRRDQTCSLERSRSDAGADSERDRAPRRRGPDSPAVAFPTGKAGSTIHVTEYSTATADVTLNNATWVSSGCYGGGGCNVIELTIAGKSSAPFIYTQTSVTAASSPWRQDPNRDIQGGSSMVDYQKINKVPPLRSGSVTDGQTAHGFIAYDGAINQGDVYVEFSDPDAPAAPTPLAGWKVHT
jgi:hypothetical protein